RARPGLLRKTRRRLARPGFPPRENQEEMQELHSEALPPGRHAWRRNSPSSAVLADRENDAGLPKIRCAVQIPEVAIPSRLFLVRLEVSPGRLERPEPKVPPRIPRPAAQARQLANIHNDAGEA